MGNVRNKAAINTHIEHESVLRFVASLRGRSHRLGCIQQSESACLRLLFKLRPKRHTDTRTQTSQMRLNFSTYYLKYSVYAKRTNSRSIFLSLCATFSLSLSSFCSPFPYPFLSLSPILSRANVTCDGWLVFLFLIYFVVVLHSCKNATISNSTINWHPCRYSVYEVLLRTT